MASNKTVVVKKIWENLQHEGEGRRVVYFDDVLKAIEQCNEADNVKRSKKNPANFMKDLARHDNASDNWPKSLAEQRISGRQRVGGNRVFEFIDYAADQTEPLPNPYYPKPGMAAMPLQSLRLPLASKALGRKDESWLVQVTVALSLLEQHMATVSKLPVIEVVHLQIGVKLANSEIDSLFRGVLDDGLNEPSHILLTCEAKQKGERIVDHQIIEQIVAAAKSVQSKTIKDELNVERIVPIAVKAIGDEGEVYIAEFEPWTINEALAEESEIKQLTLASEALYALLPPVPGIGFTKKAPKRRRA